VYFAASADPAARWAGALVGPAVMLTLYRRKADISFHQERLDLTYPIPFLKFFGFSTDNH
jgi:hypothetical protein